MEKKKNKKKKLIIDPTLERMMFAEHEKKKIRAEIVKFMRKNPIVKKGTRIDASIK